MWHIRFFNSLLILVLLLGAGVACRKKNLKKVGLTEQVTPIDSNTPLTEWTKIPSEYVDIENMCIYDTFLFFNGNTIGTRQIAYMTMDEQMSLFMYVNGDNTVKTMESFEGKLYYGGNIITGYGLHLFSVTYVGGNLNGFDVDPSSNSYVSDLEDFQGHLFFTGKFPSTSLFVTTAYADRLTPNDYTVGAVGLTGEPVGMFTDYDELFAYGNSILFSSKIAQWSGSSWQPFNSWLPSSATINAFAKYNDTVFVGYTLPSAPNVVYSGKIKSQQVYPINQFSVLDGGVLHYELADGELYAYGKGLKINGVYTNVLKYTNGVWGYDKVISEPVNDIIIFNQHLYAATPKGLYRQ